MIGLPGVVADQGIEAFVGFVEAFGPCCWVVELTALLEAPAALETSCLDAEALALGGFSWLGLRALRHWSFGSNYLSFDERKLKQPS